MHMKKSITIGWFCLMVCCQILQAQSLSERLDAIDTSMAGTREALARSEETLETVRQTLYDQALRAREVKLTAEAMRPLRNDPISGEAVEKLLNQVRSYMALSSQELRSNRDRLDILEQMFEDAITLMKGLEKELAEVEGAAGSTLEMDRKLASVQSELRDARASLANVNRELGVRDQTVTKLNVENRELKDQIAAMEASRAAEIQAELARDHLGAGQEALAAGRFDEASFSFRNELARNPESLEARVGLAACLFEVGELAGAKELVDQVLDEDKRNASALGLRGALLFREGELKDARKDLERALRYDELNYYNHNYLGVVYQGLGDTKAAIEQIMKAVELAPSYASAHYNLAILYVTAEEPDIELAGAHYDQFLQLGGQPNADLEQFLVQTPIEE
jgi:tetratricopeptide (TPR) repeat protein